MIYDWNHAGRERVSARRVEFDDETLRDGLQSPSVTDPPIEKKIEILHLMDSLGIDSADIGLPGAGPRAVADVTRLAREIVDCKLDIRPNCASRTVRADIEPIVDISQKVGIAIEACTFIGSSPIRQYAEGWSLEMMLTATEDAVKFAASHDLPVMYVTEDTTRAHPDTIRALYTTAIEAGARRICVCDTVGHVTPGRHARADSLHKIYNRSDGRGCEDRLARPSRPWPWGHKLDRGDGGGRGPLARDGARRGRACREHSPGPVVSQSSTDGLHRTATCQI